jgi:hypothetical protein
MATTTPTDTFTWPKPAKRLLATYLRERTSPAADAPHQGLPFINEAGVLRVKPSDWMGWLEGQHIAAPKRDALAALKDAGLVQKVYKLPGEKRSFGLYTGPAPAGTAKLPRRAQRATAAAA